MYTDRQTDMLIEFMELFSYVLRELVWDIQQDQNNTTPTIYEIEPLAPLVFIF